MLETYRGVVRPAQLDHMDHMNVQYYTAKFDEASWHWFSALGLTSEYFNTENCGMAAVLQVTNYKAEAIAGDLLTCQTEMLEVKNKVIRFMHHMQNSETGVLIATSELTAVHLDRAARKSCPIPGDIIKKCKEML